MSTELQTVDFKPAKVAPVVRDHEPMVNDAPTTFDDSRLPVGTCAHQGDVTFTRIDALPKSAKPRGNPQLAVGNTQGSRHILISGEAFDCDADAMKKLLAKVTNGSIKVVHDMYIGPVFRTTNGHAEVDHPEHGNHIFSGDMIIACTYQRNLDAEEREARVRD